MQSIEPNNLNGENLARLVDQRHACLVQMHKLGVKQSELVVSGEIGALLRLLSIKNQLIVALQSIEQQLAPFQLQDPQARYWPSKNMREQCADQLERCQRLLDEIMHMERENEEKMIERRDQLANQLQVAQSASTARRAYQAHRHSAPRPVVSTATNTTDAPTDFRVEA